MSNRISCKQRVSHQCVKVYDTSNCLNSCKRSCTGCMKRVFHQYAAACVSWDYHLGWMNNCTDHNWNAFPPNVLTCAIWGDHLFCRNRCTLPRIFLDQIFSRPILRLFMRLKFFETDSEIFSRPILILSKNEKKVLIPRSLETRCHTLGKAHAP